MYKKNDDTRHNYSPVSIDKSSNEKEDSAALSGYSDSKNVYGIDIEKAKPVGSLLAAILIPLTIFFVISFLSNPTAFAGVVVWLGLVGTGLVLYFRVSETTAMRVNNKLQNAGDDSEQSDVPTKSVCRECRSEVSPDVDRCPECGWKPKKRGGLWWGTTAVLSLNPIGWALGAKGASDNYKASKGVTKNIEAEEMDESQEEAELSTGANDDPTDTLERLNKLKTQGAITEAEFEEKKKELLDRI